MTNNLFQNIWGNVQIGEGTKIAAFVEIGDGVVIGKNCKIQAFAFIPPGVTIGDEVFIGPHVTFCNDKYPSATKTDFVPEKTFVEDGAKIGAGSVILPGVRIGANALIGAGSVVTKNIPANTKWCGNPAIDMKR